MPSGWPLLPPARVGPKGRRREKHPRRRIVDAIFSVVQTGCSWRELPKDFPPCPTAYWYFTWWHDDGTVERVHDALRARVRRADGRNTEPSAGLIDSQSIRTADTVPAATRGFDAGKKVKGTARTVPPARVRDTGHSWRRRSRRGSGGGSPVDLRAGRSGKDSSADEACRVRMRSSPNTPREGATPPRRMSARAEPRRGSPALSVRTRTDDWSPGLNPRSAACASAARASVHSKAL
ncbi:transposase [Streptomyces sp. NPDC001068]|uniref:transposase n=1 Tax=Streptomyces sp. NPDC001068 TaxID=3364544 RepID=UPI0036CAB744